jgi:23S rRNA pseudouridine1911/1915/1917 synthase
MKEVIVEENNIRLDTYLASKLDISRSKVQKLIKEDKVTVNDKKLNGSYLVNISDVIKVNDELDFDIHIKAQDIPIDIVYENDDLLIINKPSGMVVHPAPGNLDNTLVNALLGKFNLSNDNLRPGIVHRLDKDTSGLMLVAKNDWAHDKLAEMIKNKDVKRTYLALVSGVINHETGTIDAPIGRDLVYREKMKVTDVNSKDAITHFKVIKRFRKHTLIECYLETGRTHQIRVHMEYIGYPIYNDPLYGKSKNTTEFGQFLHSKSIRFIHPITKKELYYEVEPPKEFQDYLEKLENNQQ